MFMSKHVYDIRTVGQIFQGSIQKHELQRNPPLS